MNIRFPRKIFVPVVFVQPEKQRKFGGVNSLKVRIIPWNFHHSLEFGVSGIQGEKLCWRVRKFSWRKEKKTVIAPASFISAKRNFVFVVKLYKRLTWNFANRVPQLNVDDKIFRVCWVLCTTQKKKFSKVKSWRRHGLDWLLIKISKTSKGHCRVFQFEFYN